MMYLLCLVFSLLSSFYRQVKTMSNPLFLFLRLQVIGILGIVYGVLILKSIGVVEVNGQVGFPLQALMPIILISLGSIVVFISFLGCCGAIRESVCMTMSYATFLLILLILQLPLVVLLFTHREEFENAMGNVIENAWNSEHTYKGGVFDTIQKSVSALITKHFPYI